MISNKNHFHFIITLFILCIIITACGPEKNEEQSSDNKPAEQPRPRVVPPEFNSDSAYLFIQKQADMGPRVPGSKAHSTCVAWMKDKLTQYGASVIIQDGVVTTFDQKKWNAKNVIGSFNPENKSRILLCAHFDSRPFCDNDSISSNKQKACPGINDGASGVGALIEIARNISIKQPSVGIDIVLFDLEDYGQPEGTSFPPMENSWCLGSQYWAKSPHKQGYFANYGILLDMVGGKNATFYKEGNSIFFASAIVDKVWSTAANLGYGNYFIQEPYGEFIDDHVYINKLSNIPTIDIIPFDRSGSRFFSHHHKLGDDMSNIDKSTLKAVGQTVLEVIYNDN